MFKKFVNLLHKNKPDQVYYVLSLNDKTYEFPTKKEMLGFVKSYSLQNVVYGVAMFKFKVYPVEK